MAAPSKKLLMLLRELRLARSLTAIEAAPMIGASADAARRYLELLAEQGFASITHDAEHDERPGVVARRYWLRPEWRAPRTRARQGARA
jgi:response regulator of citrate/malate metabolism